MVFRELDRMIEVALHINQTISPEERRKSISSAVFGQIKSRDLGLKSFATNWLSVCPPSKDLYLLPFSVMKGLELE